MAAGAVGLPDGFVLDQTRQSAPSLPDGFVLDQRPQSLGEKIGALWENPPQGPSMIGLARHAYDAVTGAVQSANDIYRPAGSTITEDQAAARDVLPQQTYEAAKIFSPVTPSMRALQIGKRAIEAPVAPSAEELKTAAKAGYNSDLAMSVQVAPQAMRDFANNLRTQLADKGLDADVAPKVDATLGRLVNAPDGATFTGKNFRSLQRKLGNIAKNNDEKPAALEVLNALNSHIENLVPKDLVRGTPEDAASISNIYREANANYAAGKRADLIQGKAELADLNAKTAHSGMNLDNALRQQVKSILKSKKDLRGFSDEEKAMMMRVAAGTAPGNVIRTVGNFLGGGGGLGALVSAGEGIRVAGPAGVAAPLAGWALKKTGNALTARNVAKLDELVRSRSPLARQQFEQAISDAGGRNANSLQLLMSAAFLQDPSGRLNRAIANYYRSGGTVPAAAEGEQDSGPRI